MNYNSLLIIIIASLLGGCSADEGFEDLKGFMNEVRAKPKGTIEPLPTFKPHEVFSYNASTLRSPFQLTIKTELIKQPKLSNVKPNESRAKQFLESFNIDDFTMVGTLSNQAGIYALLRGAGSIHRVQMGDYLGRNHGRIISISSDRIEVMEIVPDGDGGWSERPQVLPLKERSS
jgi:type IV pilus assembly protein PilP